MKVLIRSLVLAAVAAGWAACAQAGIIYSHTISGTTDVWAGWTKSSSCGDADVSSALFSIDGFAGQTTDSSAYVLFTNATNAYAKIDTGVAWQANTTYTMSVYVGNRDDTNFTGGFQGGFCQLGNSSSMLYGSVDCQPADGKWSVLTMTVTTGSTAPSGDVWMLVAGAGDAVSPFPGQALFGDVKLTATAVPEPSTFALLGCGLVGMIAYAWRKRK